MHLATILRLLRASRAPNWSKPPLITEETDQHLGRAHAHIVTLAHVVTTCIIIHSWRTLRCWFGWCACRVDWGIVGSLGGCWISGRAATVVNTLVCLPRVCLL